MPHNVTEKIFGGTGYLSSLTKTILDLYKNINQEDPTVEEHIMKSSYGKQYITKDHIQKELYKYLEDMKDKISKLLESNEESEIEKIIKSAQSNHAIILTRCLLREINNNEVQTEYKKNREEYITNIIHKIYSDMQIPVEEKEVSQLTNELITILDSQRKTISQSTEEISKSTRELTTTLNSQKERISQLIEKLSQLTEELKTILDFKEMEASLDENYLVGILEIIYESCKDNDKFKEKLEETLDNQEFTQDTRNQLAQHIIPICENIRNSQYKNLLYDLAFTLEGKGAGIIRSPSKTIKPLASPRLLQDPTRYDHLNSGAHHIVTPPPAKPTGTGSNQDALEFSQAPVKRVVHDPVLTTPYKMDTHGTMRTAPPLLLYPYHNDPAPLPTQRQYSSVVGDIHPTPKTPFTQTHYRGVSPANLRTPTPFTQTHYRGVSPANLRTPTPVTHTASPQQASSRGVSPAHLRQPSHCGVNNTHPGAPTHFTQTHGSRGVSPALRSGRAQTGGVIMSATFVFDNAPPPSHAQSKSPSRPVKLINPPFRLRKNSQPQWQR